MRHRSHGHDGGVLGPGRATRLARHDDDALIVRVLGHIHSQGGALAVAVSIVIAIGSVGSVVVVAVAILCAAIACDLAGVRAGAVCGLGLGVEPAAAAVSVSTGIGAAFITAGAGVDVHVVQRHLAHGAVVVVCRRAAIVGDPAVGARRSLHLGSGARRRSLLLWHPWGRRCSRSRSRSRRASAGVAAGMLANGQVARGGGGDGTLGQHVRRRVSVLATRAARGRGHGGGELGPRAVAGAAGVARGDGLRALLQAAPQPDVLHHHLLRAPEAVVLGGRGALAERVHLLQQHAQHTHPERGRRAHDVHAADTVKARRGGRRLARHGGVAYGGAGAVVGGAGASVGVGVGLFGQLGAHPQVQGLVVGHEHDVADVQQEQDEGLEPLDGLVPEERHQDDEGHEVVARVTEQRPPSELQHLPGEHSAHADDEEHVEHRGADDGAEPDITLRDEGANERREQLGGAAARSHKGGASHIV